MIRSLLASTLLGAALALNAFPASADTIIDQWATVKAPPPPTLQTVHVDPATTALLVLDFVPATCRGPVCQAALPAVAKILQAARASHALVVYSGITNTTAANVLPAVAPLGNEPFVVSHGDKFIGTDLAKILSDKGIKTVVVTGVTAQAAVLFTASHAALLGLNVVVPVDAMPAELPYAEQFVAWNLVNAPGMNAVKLSSSTMLSF